jgi:IMP dehydrogenase
MAELEIGAGKSARRGYGLDEISIVPSRRTRDAADVDVSFQLDAFDLAMPVFASALDAVVSPESAACLSGLGGVAAINLEGLWTRYEDPEPLLAEIAHLDPSKATSRLQEIYAEPIKPTLLIERVRALGSDGMISCGAVTPQRAAELAPAILSAELDILMIQGTVVSAEHVASGVDPLNLRRFIYELDIPIVVGGCSSYQTALHLMRTGAVGVLVGVGSGGTGESRGVLGIGVPQATAIADAAGARSRHLEETGVYVQVIADGGMSKGGDIAKAIACGADAVMIGSALAAAVEAPGHGSIWPNSSFHQRLPRGTVERVGTVGTMEEILLGPSNEPTGRLNLVGSLRQSMAMSGYATIREFHKADVVVGQAPGERSVLASDS